MKKALSLILMLMQLTVLAQSANESLKQGNKLYKEKNYDEAEINYRKALEAEKKEPIRAEFNLGDALYKQERYEEAATQFSKVIAKTEDKELKAKALHNLGNTLVRQEKLQPAVEAYKKSLMLNPKDNETRQNLAYTLKAIQKKQQQQQQQKQNQEKKNIEPSEFAKQLKAKCDILVKNFDFATAYQLMQEGLQKDETVAYYNDFIKKLKDVVEIN